MKVVEVTERYTVGWMKVLITCSDDKKPRQVEHLSERRLCEWLRGVGCVWERLGG
jgi:hypothetical protein